MQKYFTLIFTDKKGYGLSPYFTLIFTDKKGYGLSPYNIEGCI